MMIPGSPIITFLGPTKYMYINLCTSTNHLTSKILLSLQTFFPWHFLHLSFGLITSPEK